MNKYLEEILTEMFLRVGKPLGNVKKERWFLENSWTEKEQESFKNWMIKYLMENAHARRAIMSFPLKNKKRISRAVNEFLFNYGWKIKN